MSPPVSIEARFAAGFPRVSGDEPDARYTYVNNDKFSPRERG